MKNRIYLLMLGILIGLLGLGIFANHTIQTVRVSGPIYVDIMHSKNFIADIMPPPLYLVENQLTLWEIQNESDADKQKELIQKLKLFETQYNDRDQFWNPIFSDNTQISHILNENKEIVKEYFTAIQEQWIPLINQGDLEGASKLLNTTISDLYRKHRIQVDKLVITAQEREKRSEDIASQTANRQLAMLFLFSVLGLSAVLIVLFLFGGSVYKSIRNTAILMENIAEGDGDLTSRLPEQGVQEIRELAIAFNAFADKVQTLVKEVLQNTRYIQDYSKKLIKSSPSD